MGVNKVIYNNTTLIDLTGDTVTADTLAEGVVAHDASGETIVGTMSASSGSDESTTRVTMFPSDGSVMEYLDDGSTTQTIFNEDDTITEIKTKGGESNTKQTSFTDFGVIEMYTDDGNQIHYGDASPNDSLGIDGDVFIKNASEAGGIDENVLVNMSDAIADDMGKYSVNNSGVTLSTTMSKFGGKSLYFNGSSYLEIPVSISGDMTLDFWMYSSAYGSSYDTPFNLPSGSIRGIYCHIMSGSTKIASATASSTFNEIELPRVVSQNAWHHVAVVKSGSNVSFYIDGALWGTCSGSLTTYDKLVFGHLCDATSATKFKGYIDEIRLSNVVRWSSPFDVPKSAYTDAVGSPAQLYMKINGAWTLLAEVA